MSKKNIIPMHTLDNNLGIVVRQLKQLGLQEDSILSMAHRDDHYIFIFQEKGSTRMMIDFKEVEGNGRGVFCILPGQVHHGITVKNVAIWFLAVDGALLHEQYRAVFEENMLPLNLVDISKVAADRLTTCFSLLLEIYNEPNQNQMIRSLTDVVTGMFAGLFSVVQDNPSV